MRGFFPYIFFRGKEWDTPLPEPDPTRTFAAALAEGTETLAAAFGSGVVFDVSLAEAADSLSSVVELSGAPLIQPVLSGEFSVTETAGVGLATFSVNKPCRLYWGLASADILSSDPEVAGPEIAAGTGLLGSGSFLVTAGTFIRAIPLPGGVYDEDATLYVIARDESATPNSDWSNILKDTTVWVDTNIWDISIGSGSLTVNSHPRPTTPAWNIVAGNTTLTVLSHPE